MAKISDETGRIMPRFVQHAGLVLLTLVVLGTMFHFLMRVVHDDAATEDTIKELSSRAISISTQMISGQGAISDQEHGPITRRGYTAMTYSSASGFFEIMLLPVPERVCKRLQKYHWNLPTSIYINGRLVRRPHDDRNLCGKYNRMAFEFSRDLNGNVSDADKPKSRHCLTDADCGGCSACQNEICQTGCNAGETCGMTLAGRPVCCAKSEFVNPVCCPYTEDDKCCWGRNKCCPKNKPIRLNDGTCTDCYDTRVFAMGDPPNLQECLTLCPNRVDFGAEGLCMVPVCSVGEFTARDGSCVACDDGGGVETSAQECGKCPNRSYQNGRCSLPCPVGTMPDATGACVSCGKPSPIAVADPSQCEQLCPGRVAKGRTCVPAECPVGSVADTTGTCVPCDIPVAIDVASPDMCERCTNRLMEGRQCVLPCGEGFFRAENGVCVACDDPTAVPVKPNSGACAACPKRLALSNYCFADCGIGEFRDNYGDCHSCTDLKSYPITQTAACAICPNRSTLLYQEGGQNQPYCRSQYCPMDYFADQMGSCYDCYLASPVTKTSKAECLKCSNRFWSPIGNTCRIKPTCEVGMLLDSTGTCQPCQAATEAYSVIGQEEACDVCPNRYLFGYWCRRCPADVTTLTTKDGCQVCGGHWDNRISRCQK